MATQPANDVQLPRIGPTTFRLMMTVLAQAGDNPQNAPFPGTLHDAVNGTELARLPQDAKAEASEIDATGCWVRLTAGNTAGWCHLSGLIPSVGKHVPWLEVAQREIGVSEEDDAGLARIGHYLASVEPPATAGDNWCACFINWCMHKAQAGPLDTSRARKWAKWKSRRTGPGRVPSDARLGDLAVGERHAPQDGKPGHVAILLAYGPAEDPIQDSLLLLGGNQSRNPLDGVQDKKTSVRYSWYPRATEEPPSKLVSVNFDPAIDG